MEMTPRLEPLELTAPSGALVTTISLEGEVGSKEFPEIHTLLFELAQRGVRNIVIDFAEVSHFDFRGVKPLCRRAEAFRGAGGDIKLCGLSPYIAAIFRSAGAWDGFDYFVAAPEAVAAFERVVYVAE